MPFQKTTEFQALGYPDTTPDTRGGLGPTGLKKLYEFVRAGGTLITEGGTSSIFPSNYLTPGITIDQGNGLTAPGSVYRGIVNDRTSPIVYGIPRNHIPVYYKQNGGPMFSVGGYPGPLATAPAAPGGRAGGRGGANYQQTQPMGASQNVFGTWDPTKDWTAAAAAPAPEAAAAAGGGGGRAGGAGAGGGGGRGGGAPAQFGGRGGGGGAGGAAQLMDFMRPRVILAFPPAANDMLLSGGVVGAENLENRPQLIDAPVGKGHVIMFAIRPFWRWQTQGTFILGFNAIMNWNDLNAGK